MAAILAAVLFLSAPVNVYHAAAIGADAVVLVNSASARFLDFQHSIQPYLDNFGVPYTVLDISTNSVDTNLTAHALIIIGHNQLDSSGLYLDAASQHNLANAVASGVGLVNFDSSFAVAGRSPPYQFVQDIFGFSSAGSFASASVTFPATEHGATMHYITARHPAGETMGLSNAMNVAGLNLSSNDTAVATSGGQPLVVVAKYGLGRAVQWASYDWMSTTVQGPVNGFDDLLWRGLVWAARKPFAMRGLPNFVTLRVDDCEGPFWWTHAAMDLGFKPWIGLFTENVTDANAADVKGMAATGNLTTSLHALTASYLCYWDQANSTNWPDLVVSNNIYSGGQWYASRGIPISKVVVPHYSEMGPNAVAGLRGWGIEYSTLKNDPGTIRDSPWLVAGPYRLYEPRQLGSIYLPVFYADFLNVPGHPEFNGQIFNCVTEVRNAQNAGEYNCGEWCPSPDVTATINRGTRTLKRALDSQVLATLFTHEWYIHATTCCGASAIPPNSWTAILQGITNNLAAYQPIYVTMDYACQYVRAMKTSRMVSSDYDPVIARLTAVLSGKTDLETSVFVFTGEDNAITSTAVTVPAFAGTANVLLASFLPPTLSIAPTPSNSLVVSWPNPSPGFSLREKAVLSAASWTPVTNLANTNGTQVQVVVPIISSNWFFRLSKP